MLGSAPRPIFAEVEQRRGQQKNTVYPIVLWREWKRGEWPLQLFLWEKCSLFRVSKAARHFPTTTSNIESEVGRCSIWHPLEMPAWLGVDVSQTFSRKSLWLFSVLTKRASVRSPHGFLWSILPFPSLRFSLLVVGWTLISKGPWEWAGQQQQQAGVLSGPVWSAAHHALLCGPDGQLQAWQCLHSCGVHQAFIWLNFPSLSKTGNKTGDITDLDRQEQAVPFKCKHFLLCLSFYVFQSHMLILYVAILKFVQLRLNSRCPIHFFPLKKKNVFFCPLKSYQKRKPEHLETWHCWIHSWLGCQSLVHATCILQGAHVKSEMFTSSITM